MLFLLLPHPARTNIAVKSIKPVINKYFFIAVSLKISIFIKAQLAMRHKDRIAALKLYHQL